MKYTKAYGAFHWFIHLMLASALVWSTNLLIVNIVIPITILGHTWLLNIVDVAIVYVITFVIDLDHLKVFRMFGRKGIMAFARKRITYPLHSFFTIALFSSLSALSALFGAKALAVLLFAPVVHMFWDMVEDVFIFRATYRKWEKTWGIGSNELRDLWKELQKADKKTDIA